MVSQSEVLSYASRHGVAAAAVRFGVNDRTIRKWRARAAAPAAPAAPVSVPSAGSAPAYVPLDLNQVANGREYWRCVGCDDFVRVPAGVRRSDWQQGGCALHSAPVAVADVPAPVAAIDVPAQDVGPLLDGSTGCAAPAPVPLDVVAPATCTLHKEEVQVTQIVSDNSFRSVVLAWLLEYWRVPLAVVVGVLLLVFCF